MREIEKKLKPSRVLVTGGAGFIGSHLCERLIQGGCEVICVDNEYSGSKQNVSHLLSNPQFEFIRHDITFPLYLEVDQIYNLACPASPKHYQRDPVQTIKVNVHGAINMLGLAKRCNAQILQASTSEVYGDPKEAPQSEGYWGHVNPIGIRSCYDEGKRAAETLFMDYHRQHGVRIKIVRIFNTYGPKMRENDGRVISNFVLNALTNQALEVYGQGMQTRCFCFVDELVEGLIKIMSSQERMIGPINLGSDKEISVLSLAQTVHRLTNTRAEIKHFPEAADDPQRRRPDLTYARRLLDWNPKVGIEEGLRRTIAYYRERLSSIGYCQ